MSEEQNEEHRPMRVVDKRRFLLDDEGEIQDLSEERPREDDRPAATPAPAPEAAPQPQPAPSQPQPSAAAPHPEPQQPAAPSQQRTPINQAFVNFVQTLAQTTLMHMGDMPDPSTGLISQNMPAARHTIDILEALLIKTQGNLALEEEKMLAQWTQELKLLYVQHQTEAAPTMPPQG